MKKVDLLKLINSATDEQDINSLLGGTDIETQFKGAEPTLDTFKQKAKTDKEFKAFIDGENDKHYVKALSTWKENNLEKELEPFIQAKYPDLIKDPMQKQLLEVQKELAAAKSESAREKLLTQAIKYASEKKMPTGFVEKFLGEDLDTTKANLDVLALDWSKGLEASVAEKFKSSSYVPGGTGADGTKTSIGAAMAQQNNGSKTAPSDPWATK